MRLSAPLLLFLLAAPPASAQDTKLLLDRLNRPFPHTNAREMPLSQRVRLSGLLELEGTGGKTLRVRVAGSTHDWEGDTDVARPSEMRFLRKALLDQKEVPGCDLLLEQEGEDFLPNVIAGMAATSPALAKADPALLAQRLRAQANDPTELGQMAREFTRHGRRALNADLHGGLGPLDYVFERHGPARVYELVFHGMAVFFGGREALPAALGLALGDELLQRTKNAAHFRKHPFSKSSPYARNWKHPSRYPTSAERDAYFARRMREHGKDSCFLAHTGHVIGALEALGQGKAKLRIDAIEPNTDLERQLRSDRKLCREFWPASAPGGFRCP